MTLLVSTVEQADSDLHCFRAVALDSQEDWLDQIAAEYVKLRSECSVPVAQVNLDGIQVVSVERLNARLRTVTIPARRTTEPLHLDVVRSDFGETIAYLLLEQEFGTLIGYKSIRDRETAEQPGRGLDVVGIEEGERLTLVLGEVKVSDEVACPPGVVERGNDSLRAQHAGHLSDYKRTAAKIWNQTRKVLDTNVRNKLFAAALLLEEQQLDQLRLIVYCLLVRPRDRYAPGDFGCFRNDPAAYEPAQIRFHVVCVPGAQIEPLIAAWYKIVQQQGQAA